jgi:hypothetical protein
MANKTTAGILIHRWSELVYDMHGKEMDMENLKGLVPWSFDIDITIDSGRGLGLTTFVRRRH